MTKKYIAASSFEIEIFDKEIQHYKMILSNSIEYEMIEYRKNPKSA